MMYKNSEIFYYCMLRTVYMLAQTFPSAQVYTHTSLASSSQAKSSLG
jgi:hypothetical protein